MTTPRIWVVSRRLLQRGWRRSGTVPSSAAVQAENGTVPSSGVASCSSAVCSYCPSSSPSFPGPATAERATAPSLGLALAVLLTASAVSAQDVPAAIPALYDEVRIAIETEDTESIRAHLTPLAQVRAAVGQGLVPDVGRICQEQENLAVEVRLDEANVVADKAFVLVTWAMSGRTTATQDPWNTTVQRADVLVRRGGVWQFVSSDEVDATAFSRVANGTYEDRKVGLQLEAPPKWRVVPLAGFKSFVMAVAPDASAWLMWLASDLPGTFTAEQLSRAQQDTLEKLAPTFGLEIRDTTMTATSFAGRPAFAVHRTIVAQDGTETRQLLTHCVIGSTAYISGYGAMPPSAYQTHKQEIDRALASTQVSAPEVAELPPEAGRIEDRKYVNDTYGCEMTAPEEWGIRIGQGEWDLQVSMQPPGGDSFITLATVALTDPTATAEQQVLGDDILTSRAFENFEVIRQGETQVGTLPAYESVTRFDFGGQVRRRWRVYLVDQDRLFLMFADVVPADAWDSLEKLIRETFQSFRLLETQPRTEAP
jgi:hypothetical protein